MRGLPYPPLYPPSLYTVSQKSRPLILSSVYQILTDFQKSSTVTLPKTCNKVVIKDLITTDTRHYTVKYKFSKFVLTAVTQQLIMHANPEENVAMVDELILCQEDQLYKFIIQYAHALALSAVIRIIFSPRSGLEETCSIC